MNTGFYWVKYRDEWIISHYNSEPDRWEIIGSDVSVRTIELQDINENRLNQKEKEKVEVVKKQDPTIITITIKIDGGSVEIVK